MNIHHGIPLLLWNECEFLVRSFTFGILVHSDCFQSTKKNRISTHFFSSFVSIFTTFGIEFVENLIPVAYFTFNTRKCQFTFDTLSFCSYLILITSSLFVVWLFNAIYCTVQTFFLFNVQLHALVFLFSRATLEHMRTEQKTHMR